MCTFPDPGNVIESYILIDSGTSGISFIDEDYVHHHPLPLHLLKSPRDLTDIDGRRVTLKAITQVVPMCLTI
jgi:hypothetical protein